jgi:FMN phosphatase YigB (HAD superfamily)
MATQAAGLVLDLDGTLYRGDAPLWAYALAMAGMAEPQAGRRLVERARAFLADSRTLAPFRDPWAALSALGAEAGLDWPSRDRAFLAVRDRICRGELAVEVPAGVRELLRDLDPRVRVAVLTNSDEASARRLMAYLGLGRWAARVEGAVRKPAGFAPAALRQLGAAAARAVSVGDNHANDVLPARAMGMRTVHVRLAGAEGGQADLTVDRLEEAVPWLRRVLASLAAGEGEGEAALPAAGG